MTRTTTAIEVLVVLGSRVHEGQARGALLRRLERAAVAARELGAHTVLMSGGKEWQGHVEARVMADWWQRHGPASAAVFVEERSQNTRENARESARWLAERGLTRVGLVTCDFHMARARGLFVRQGVDVVTLSALKTRSVFERARLFLREAGASFLDRYQESQR